MESLCYIKLHKAHMQPSVFADNNEVIQFYTGLNSYEIVMIVFGFCLAMQQSFAVQREATQKLPHIWKLVELQKY